MRYVFTLDVITIGSLSTKYGTEGTQPCAAKFHNDIPLVIYLIKFHKKTL